ncbi:MAG: ATP phosphoribosyltransferase regulatory subunit, partial [Phycisphaerae bacterium]|nr:ATP phosphoribosyltransferase regulatory subunit [Phycisphaerae bacterium]
MKIQAVKGTRDFYPEDMAKRNYIADLWKQVSLRNGFVEYDGPIFEYLAMYQQKSGDEIASQLFAFQDRGERMLAIRPEITPTLARMVNQRINTLPRPLKWFSVPRLCRAERPQKGRLREFFQWNVDVIGIEDCLADAEVIFCAADFLLAAG